MDINEIQFRILDALYFVEPFETLLEEVGASENIIANELRQLISHRYVQAMRYDNATEDYVPSTVFNSDDLREFRYLATKEGLLKHNGFR